METNNAQPRSRPGGGRLINTPYINNLLASTNGLTAPGGGDVPSDYPPFPASPFVSFQIDFCNIRELLSKFVPVEHHFSSDKLHLLFLTETQVDGDCDSDRFSVDSYCLYSHFSAKGGCCAYVHNDVIHTRVPDLESSEFSTIWLKLSQNSMTKFFCSVYLSPNSTNYPKFFDYLNSKIEHILSTHPFAEITILGDFNVHHRQWFSSNSTDTPGELAFNFSICNDIEQMVQTPTRLPDRLGDVPNLLDLFLTSIPSAYSVETCPPLGTSDHLLISSTCSITHSRSLERPPPSARRRL